MKFIIGDRFQAQDTGKTGRIVNVNIHLVDYTQDRYTVEWDHLGARFHFDYEAFNVDKVWDKIPQNNMFTATVVDKTTGKVIGTFNNVTFGPILDNLQTCNHEDVTYHGLKETYEYCKHCDRKKI